MAEEKKRGVTSETEVNTTELATVLGVTARRVQQLAQDGTIETHRRGYFILCDAVQRYIAFAAKGSGNRDQERAKLDAEVRLKEAKADEAELELAEVRGQMHRAEDVEAMTADLIFAVRGALMALPGRLAVDVSATTAAEASAIIRREVRAVMQELSEHRYDPERYRERVRARRDWKTGAGWDDEDDRSG